ncbi:MAG: Trm112 family protein [Pseudomonadota bacterium]
MNQKLLDIVCCPLTHQPLHKASAPLLGTLNQRIEQGEMHNASGTILDAQLQAALVTEDERRIYPIYDGLVSLLASESIVLEDDS